MLHSGYILNNVPSVLSDVLKQAELFQGCTEGHFIWTSIGSASFGLLITLSVISHIQLLLGWTKVMENYNHYLKSNRMLPSGKTQRDPVEREVGGERDGEYM